MRHDRRRSKSPEEQTYFSQLARVSRRLNALIDNDDSYSSAVNALLDDAIKLLDNAITRCDDTETWQRDDRDDALRLLDQAVTVLTAAEERVKVERETRETSGLREYTVLFAVVSELYRRLHQDARTRIGRAYVGQVKAAIEKAVRARPEGDIDCAVHYLHHAAQSLGEANRMEETFGPQLDQLWQWYEIVARGVEPKSEADDCLERFVVAVDVFNGAIAQDDTDHIIETFDAAVALLKDAAAARPRR